jgi:hypothetical protein
MKTFQLICVILMVVGVAPVWASTPSTTLYPRLNRDTAEKKPAPAVQGASAAAFSEMEDADRKFFLDGYDNYAHRRYDEALEALFEFLGRKTTDDQDYEWAEFFFGISLKRLGFSHAAVDSLTHVVTRKPNPKIVSYTPVSYTSPSPRDKRQSRMPSSA